MRLIKLKLNNYRGVGTVDIHFKTIGITVVEGPNEAGKTSLSESIQILFKYRDDSHSSQVQNLKPVNRDVGAEIELEAESGPYKFTYYKRFHKKPQTTLTIYKPKPENLTGREAHERAESILEETIDTNLWRALSINQGEELKQAELGNQYSLSEALDKAAGGGTINPKEESLFVLIKNEFNVYFTDSNKEKKILQETRNRKIEVENNLNSINSRLQEIESYVDRIPYLTEELKKNTKQLTEAKKSITQATKDLEEITKLESKLEISNVSLQSAIKSLHDAKKITEARKVLIQKISSLKNEIQKLQNEQEDLNKTYNIIKVKCDSTVIRLSEITKEFEESELKLTVSRADHQYLIDKLFLEQLSERKKRVDDARNIAASAEILLSDNKVDKKGLDKITIAEKELNDVQARSVVSLPSVLIRGISKTSININDNTFIVEKDKELDYKLDKNLEITLPKKISLTISPGQSSDDILKELEIAKNKLSSICKKYGVNNTEEAYAAFNERNKALNQIDEKKKVEEVNLRDLSYEKLATKISNLNYSVPSYIQNRNSDSIIPNTIGDAKELLEKAEEKHSKIRTEKGSIEAAVKTNLERYNEINTSARELKIKIELKSNECNAEETKLLNERGSTSDDELEKQISTYTDEVSKFEKEVKEVENSLKLIGADNVRQELDTYTKSKERIEKYIYETDKELTELNTRIQIMGEEGLQEKLDAIKTIQAECELELLNITTKAKAAELLYSIMAEERDKARQSYIKPFKTNIEKLGKLLFNETFEVQISENLEVMSRTLNNVTIPFNDLSGGTREQLSLISRLACATIVGKDSGAPVIIDDALGYTDPERLKSMGVILATAGKTCQLVILTCMPDRYSFVGDAKFIRI